MSFLYKTTPLLRTAVRSSVTRSSPRLFSTAVVQRKSATDTVKDGLKSVDRAVSDVAVAGIDKGGTMTATPSPLLFSDTNSAHSRNQRRSGRSCWCTPKGNHQGKGRRRERKGRRSSWRSQREGCRIVRTSEGQDGGSQGKDVMITVTGLELRYWG
jgi:hypothetical protein